MYRPRDTETSETMIQRHFWHYIVSVKHSIVLTLEIVLMLTYSVCNSVVTQKNESNSICNNSPLLTLFVFASYAEDTIFQTF